MNYSTHSNQLERFFFFLLSWLFYEDLSLFTPRPFLSPDKNVSFSFAPSHRNVLIFERIEISQRDLLTPPPPPTGWEQRRLTKGNNLLFPSSSSCYHTLYFAYETTGLFFLFTPCRKVWLPGAHEMFYTHGPLTIERSQIIKQKKKEDDRGTRGTWNGYLPFLRCSPSLSILLEGH